MNLLTQLIIFAFAFIYHEAGHYFMFLHYGYKDIKFDFRWEFLALGVGNNIQIKLPIKQYIPILLGGIIAGLPFALFNRTVFFAYILCCGLDIFQLGVFTGLWFGGENLKKNKEQLIRKYEREARINKIIKGVFK